MKHTDIRHGQTLIVDMGARRGGKKIVKVVKINPKNIKVQAEDGTMINAHPSFLEAAPGITWVDKSAARAAASSTGPLLSLVVGQVVKFKTTRTRDHEGLFVVLGSHGEKYRVARLGGDRNRYIRGVVPAHVEVVDFELAGV